MCLTCRVFPADLRPRGAADDVRVQDGADDRQGTLLRVRASVLGQGRHRTEGPHHGTQLHARQEGGESTLAFYSGSKEKVMHK